MQFGELAQVGVTTSKSFSLRENADSTKRESAPPANTLMLFESCPRGD